MKIDYISVKAEYVTEIVQMLIRSDDLYTIALICELLKDAERKKAEGMQK